MSTESSPTHLTILVKMAAKHKCPITVKRMQLSEVEVPWCDEFEKMICGMK
jgi:hypothetical protein